MLGKEAYLPIAVFAVISVLVGIVPVVLARLISTSQPSLAKQAPYECGFASKGSMRVPFDIRYYVVALLFILFDIETAFLFPWAVVLEDIGWPGFFAMLVFLMMLAVGLVFEWQQGALEWK